MRAWLDATSDATRRSMPRAAGCWSAQPNDCVSLREAFIAFMQRIRMPNGLQAVGYTSADIPSLIEGTMKQKRLIGISPCPVTEAAAGKMFEDSLVVW